MTFALTTIVRHPVKAIGRQTLEAVNLDAGRCLPWDRAFAVAHAGARAQELDEPWARKANFLRGVTGPQLMAVTCDWDEDGGLLTLRHPARPELAIAPLSGKADAALAAWLDPLWPADAPRPTRLIHHPDSAQTDVPETWIALNCLASHRAVAQKLGRPDLSIHRWRGNLWFDGTAPFEEFDWVDRHLRLGSVVLKGQARITRCKATMANPDTGRRDADTLGALQDGWGHTDFGLYAEVIEGGTIRTGDVLEVLP